MDLKPPDYIIDAFVLKIDFSGNQNWFYKYGHIQFHETSRTLTQVTQDEYVFSGIRYDNDQVSGFEHGWACAIDSLGNKKWEWEANESEIPYRRIMSMQYDSVNQEWVYVSVLKKPVFIEDLGYDVDLSIPILVRRDSTMQLISYQEYGPYSYNGYMGVLGKSRDGGWIAAGNFTCVTEESPYNNCNIESGRVIKLLDDGVLEWSVIDTAVFHQVLGSRSYLSGVAESPTGSIYSVGWAKNYDDNEVYRSFGWLLKITADGCVDTICTTTSLLDQIRNHNPQYKVYPNPFTDYIEISPPEEEYRTLRIRITDVNGRLVTDMESMCPCRLDLGSIPAGVYFYRLEEDGRMVGSGKVVKM